MSNESCPLLAMARPQLQQIIDNFKAVVADRSIEFSEITGLLYQATGAITGLASYLMKATFPRDDVKACIVTAVALFYDNVIAPIDIKAIPNFIEGAVDRAVREALLSGADAATNAFLGLFYPSEPIPGMPVTAYSSYEAADGGGGVSDVDIAKRLIAMAPGQVSLPAVS